MKRYMLAAIVFAIPHLMFAQDKVFDLHVHLWEGQKSLDTYYAELDSTHQTVTGFGGILIARKGEPERTRKKNDELIALSKKDPKLIPICSVHPFDGEVALAELRRIAKLGVRIIKIHPHTQDFDVTDPRVKKLCTLAGELGMTMLLDNANIKPGDSENLFNLAVGCPNTRFIFAHLGGLNFRFWNILKLARTAKDFLQDNIYFDCSATVTLVAGSPVEAEFIWTMRNIGIDHILLGSDFPQFWLKQTVDALEKMDLTKEEKEKIRYENAKKLYSLMDR